MGWDQMRQRPGLCRERQMLSFKRPTSDLRNPFCPTYCERCKGARLKLPDKSKTEADVVIWDQSWNHAWLFMPGALKLLRKP